MGTTATRAGPHQECIFLGDDFRLDLRLRQLYRRDRILKLERIPLELLILLVENPGELVPREQIVERIWGGGVFLDTDNAIRGAVHKIRRVLRDNPDQPRFVQTVPGQGYRFIAPVTSATAGAREIPQESGAGEWRPDAHVAQPGIRTGLSWKVWTLAGVIVLATFLAAYASLSPLPVPKVVVFPRSPVSDAADPWQPLITDGVRVYFLERTGNRWDLVQTSAAGGEVSRVPAPFTHTRVFAASREGSEFLIGDFSEGRSSMPLWIWPVHGGAPVRVGQVRADDAAWAPRGGYIFYVRGNEIHSVQRDGASDSLLFRSPGTPRHLVWSPDGMRLMFTVIDERAESFAIWEAAADGSGARPSDLNALDSAPKCCATWTPDGRYLLFTSRHNGTTDLWAIRGQPLWWRWGSNLPVRLTSGPVSVHSAVPLPSGRRIFAFADAERFESNTYSTASGQSAPLLPGKEILTLSFSRDGQWAAFQMHPDWTLWRSRLDGTQRIALTAAPLKATHPQWSPDGKHVVFEAYVPGGPMRAYVASAEGGPLQELWKEEGEQSLPIWSPDGQAIAMALNVNVWDAPAEKRGIFVLNWKTRQAEKIPGSKGLTFPMWSPDGKYLVARTPDDKRVLRFDPQTQSWLEVFSGTKLVGPAWSLGSDTVYIQDVQEAGQPIYQIASGSWKRTRVASFEKLIGAGVRRCLLQTVAPDDSLVISLVRSESRVYSLEVAFP